MSKLIDFHTHIYPSMSLPRPLNRSREFLRKVLIKPISEVYHKTSIDMRVWPERARHLAEEVGSMAVLPMLAVESSLEDHKKAMKNSQIDFSVVVAHHPLVSNEFIIKTCKQGGNLIPAIQIPGKDFDEKKWASFIDDNKIKLIKIHPLADGMSPKSQKYNKVLKLAEAKNCVVIVHTGQLKSKILFKDSKYGRAESMKDWFKDFPKINFVLAHMNMKEPEAVWLLAQKYKNVYTTTSWQSADIVLKAVKEMGADKILFASDWPLLGGNMRVSTDRLKEIKAKVSKQDSELMTYKNAEALLGFSL